MERIKAYCNTNTTSVKCSIQGPLRIKFFSKKKNPFGGILVHFFRGSLGLGFIQNLECLKLIVMMLNGCLLAYIDLLSLA